jgi:CHAT domain-containing protein
MLPPGLNKRDVLAEMSGDYGFIHFACHATFDVIEPGKSALHLLADSDNDAMRITAEDLRGFDLKTAPLVTLSACASGVASCEAGNDLIGLSGGFFRAGARAVIGSRWPVYDDFSRRFMSELYAALQKNPLHPATAFFKVRRQWSQSDRLENWCAYSYLGH